MVNPFENVHGVYVVLVNAENQHSIWPEGAAIPSGWRAAFGPSDRKSCLDHVETCWRDMRPSSLASAA